MSVNIRLVAAAALAVAFFLPQYSCTRSPEPPPQGASATAGPAPEVEEWHYAWEDLSPSQPSSWIALLAFAWPLASILWRHEPRRGWAPRLLAEAAAIAFSAYYIFSASGLGQRRSGAHLGLAGCALYALALAAEAWRRGAEARART